MENNNQITKLQTNGLIQNVDDLGRIGEMMAKSGYFTDATMAAQASVKVLAGQEMGFGAFASMTGIYIIKGKPSIGANLMASAVKANPKYDYRVKDLNDSNCTIEFFEFVNGKRESIGVSTFTYDDAMKAGTQNLTKYPRNMLFARAMSNGIKWYCPDVFSGNTAYTPDELGAQVDDEGNIMIDNSPAGVPDTVTRNSYIEAEYVETEKSNFNEVEYLKNFKASDAFGYMTPANASGVTNSDGKTYGSLSTEELAKALDDGIRMLQKNGLSDDKKTTVKHKLSAISAVLSDKKARILIQEMQSNNPVEIGE